ncbi:hypothetical protein IMZ48_18370 [Candidatus Bathyarchaeota archaeon]|nr:hypothetical protein [Candidatus Bathyarchaeota archaeon]
MKVSVSVSVIVGALAGAAVASPPGHGNGHGPGNGNGHGPPGHGQETRNFIYIVPDGYGVASQVLARDFVSIRDGDGTTARPATKQLGADPLVRPLPIPGPLLRAP